MRKMKLREVAHARSGEKRDTVDIAVIAYREMVPPRRHILDEGEKLEGGTA